jgi:hypothetical protein
MAKHNLRPCGYCDPRSYYERELRRWTPDFELWISRESDLAYARVCNQAGYLVPPIGPPPKMYRERVDEKREKRAREKAAAAERAATAAKLADEQERAWIGEIEQFAERRRAEPTAGGAYERLKARTDRMKEINDHSGGIRAAPVTGPPTRVETVCDVPPDFEDSEDCPY